MDGGQRRGKEGREKRDERDEKGGIGKKKLVVVVAVCSWLVYRVFGEFVCFITRRWAGVV